MSKPLVQFAPLFVSTLLLLAWASFRTIVVRWFCLASTTFKGRFLKFVEFTNSCGEHFDLNFFVSRTLMSPFLCCSYSHAYWTTGPTSWLLIDCHSFFCFWFGGLENKWSRVFWWFLKELFVRIASQLIPYPNLAAIYVKINNLYPIFIQKCIQTLAWIHLRAYKSSSFLKYPR